MISSTTKAAWTVQQFCHDVGLGKSKLYQLIAQGDIETRNCGKRTLVVTTPSEFIASLPAQGEAA